MPLHIKIDVNSINITTLHIGRLDPLLAETQESEYVAWIGGFGDAMTEKNSAHFRHTYNEGALTCTRKAIEALQAKGIRY